MSAWKQFMLYSGLVTSCLLILITFYLSHGFKDLTVNTSLQRQYKSGSSWIRSSTGLEKFQDQSHKKPKFKQETSTDVYKWPLEHGGPTKNNNLTFMFTKNTILDVWKKNSSSPTGYPSVGDGAIQTSHRPTTSSPVVESTFQTDGLRDCQPRSNIVFFKMHKCSSSTVQNILFRYGEKRQLNFVLPSAGNYLGHSGFNKAFMMNFPLKEYNMFCLHTIFDYTGIAEVMPANSVYTSILRDPVQMFESVFTYSQIAATYHLPSSRGLELFLEKPDYYYQQSDGGVLHCKNPMLYNFGLSKTSIGDPRLVDEKIQQLKAKIDLVMMTEYFEESLILLRELMCWETDDVVYFVMNARTKSMVKTVEPAVAAKIKQWNSGDVKLYQTFNETFWKKVDDFGLERMKNEVAKLNERKEYFTNYCIGQVITRDSKVWRPPGINIDSVALRPEVMGDKMCVRMARTELPYIEVIRNLQMRRYGL